MTSGAQQALRRTMELFSNTTRFALACNQSTKIIEPIQSRCAILRFTRLSDVQILQRLLYVIKKENVGCLIWFNSKFDYDDDIALKKRY
jgi:replication factor C subunit 2/4